MEMQQYDQTQKMGDMQQSFNSGLDQINHNLDSAAQKTELPEPGVGEKEKGDDEGIVNPEIPDEGNPTPEEKPIIY